MLARIDAPPADPLGQALAWFDAGYLVETYRQLGLVYQHGMLPTKGRGAPLVPAEVAGLDGYAFVQKALALAPERRAELDFAASLMTPAPLAATHRRQAAAGAEPGSMLARNLELYAVE